MKFWALFILNFSALLMLQSAFAQAEINPRWDSEETLGSPQFNLKAYRRFSDLSDSLRLDIAVVLAHDMLQFVRENGSFAAKVEISLSLLDRAGSQVYRRSRRAQQVVDSHQRTKRRTEFLTEVFSLRVPAGAYTAKAALTDLESGRRETKSLEISLEPMANSGVDISDLMVSLSSEVNSATKLPLHLLADGTIPNDRSKIYCYFDIVRFNSSEPLRIALAVIDKDGSEMWFDSLSVVGGETIVSYFMPVHIENFRFGSYELVLKSQSGHSRLERRTSIYINTFGLPGVIQDLDQAIVQLELIATRNEINELKSSLPSDRERRFLEFWNRNFPTPGERVNGKMIEYYTRVKYAVQHFGNTRSGWETDRGRVFIIYGRPDEIERHPFDDNSASYEIWYYNRLGKRFLFRDEYGFGEYRLVTPAW